MNVRLPEAPRRPCTCALYATEIVESPLPLAEYKSTVSVADAGGRAVVIWSSIFEATADGMPEAVAGIYQAGLDALAAKFGT